MSDLHIVLTTAVSASVCLN